MNRDLIGETTPAGVIEMATERNDLQATSIGPRIAYVSYDGVDSFVVQTEAAVALVDPGEPDLNVGSVNVPTFSVIGPDTKAVWSSMVYLGNGATIAATIMAPSGDTYFAGWAPSPASGSPTYVGPVNLLANESYSGGASDAVIGKVDSTGKVAWVHFVGTPQEDRATTITFGTDGSPILFGTTAIRDATNTVVNANRFIASFDTNGDLRESSDQNEILPTATANLANVSWTTVAGVALDAVGNIYEDLQPYGDVTYDAVQSFQGDGTLRFSTPPQRLQAHVAVTPDGSHLYTADEANARGCTLTAYSTVDGSVQWTLMGKNTEVFTPDMTEYWLGGFESCDAIVATADSVFIAGAWSNTYQSQSAGGTTTQFGAPRGTFYVGAYDLQGNKKWFVQLTPVNTQDDQATDVSSQLFLDHQGNLLMMYTLPVAGQKLNSIEVAHLSAADGTLLP